MRQNENVYFNLKIVRCLLTREEKSGAGKGQEAKEEVYSLRNYHEHISWKEHVCDGAELGQQILP